MNNLDLIGRKVKEIRKKRKISQEKLAEMVSMNHRSIIRIENAQTIPTLETLNKISEVLGVKLIDLLETEAFESKEKIIESINEYLKGASEKDVRMFYKAVCQFFV